MVLEKEQLEKMARKESTTCGGADTRFDSIMKVVGYNGAYQKRFNIVFNFVLVMFASMPYLNFVLSLAVPDHWCHVPGRDNTTYSLEEWKNLTLPIEHDIIGKESLSKCKMYNITSFEELQTNKSDYEIIECQYGWDFDRTWYKETAPSEGKWVCSKELYVTHALSFARIGDVVGTFIFGQLGDIIGRKPVFFITLVILLIGRTLSAFSAHNYNLFVFAAFLGNLTATALFQAPLIIGMEISSDDKRSHIAMLQCISWTLGLCLMPFILWAWGHWFHFMLTTTLPCIIFLFSWNWMIESPRWLAGQGKTAKCIKQLEKIAKLNGTQVPDDAAITLRFRPEFAEKLYGIMSLFSSWRLAKNTILLTICWITSTLIYYVIVINVMTLDGNPFLNYFYQGLVEMPAYILAKILCERIGRRWSQVIPYIFGTLGCVVMFSLVKDPKMTLVIPLIAAFLKFIVALVYYASNLQTLEIYPTCIRQTGVALSVIISNGMCIFGPYIVYLGTAYDPRYPAIILGLLCIIGGVCAILLPETLHKKLPETLADAHEFGADQKYWSWPRKPETETEDPILKK